MNEKIKDLINALCNEIDFIDNVDEKINLINEVRLKIHNHSPLKHHPVDCVLWEKSNEVEANEYNPNKIPPPELELLYKSISEDGYTMSIVTFNNPDGKIKIVDGFHRRLMEQIHPDISQSTFGQGAIDFYP